MAGIVERIGKEEKNAVSVTQDASHFASRENHTGIPTQLKERMEQSTGMSFDDVRVHYNSALPARLDALAYTKGNRIEIGPGQERHLPHELGHMVQQKLGAVRANATHSSGEALNIDPELEHQADEIGAGKRVEIVRRMVNNVVQRCGGITKRFNSVQEMQTTLGTQVCEQKPKGSPDISKWFDNGGSLEIDTANKTWTYISSNGDAVPYIDGKIDFPVRYLHSTIPEVNIGRFSNNRNSDRDSCKKVLKEKWNYTDIPGGYVAHHTFTNGIMQLVDANIHETFKHYGGFSFFNS
ncbi:MAG: DUF4157 domain-containing protein [Acetatifactor sp.]|nr:DUF4157 domain-containing protein [Acetatifactor sp.]